MKHLAIILFSMVLASAPSMAEPYDTTLLKNGNTWLYAQHSERRSPVLESGFDGTSRFTIDSLAVAGDTVKFNVVREDSGARAVWPVGEDPVTHTFQTTKFLFQNAVFSPSIPLFMAGQFFTGLEGKTVYHGDTLGYKADSSVTFCGYFSRENIETVGRTRDRSSVAGCGHTSSHENYDLIAFNGRAWSADSAHPVGIARPEIGRAKSRALLRAGIDGNHRVLYTGKKYLYDARGQKARLPTAR